MLGLARRAGVVDAEKQEAGLSMEEDERERSSELESFLTVKGADGRRMAIALSEVDRLEQFPLDEIERTGESEVVQYRGEIMPLVRVSERLGHGRDEPRPGRNVSVVVSSRAGRSYGLVVDGITDIVEAVDPVTRPSTASGIRRSVVIEGGVSDQLDLAALIPNATAVEERSSDGESSTASEVVGSKQFCTFFLGDLFFGVDVTLVQEVLRPSR